MTEDEFLRQQQAAVERMREMNARAASVGRGTGHKMPPTPPFVSIQKSNVPANGSEESDISVERTAKNREGAVNAENKLRDKGRSGSALGLNIPFLDMLSADRDAALIIGLMLILISENSDKLLLFALIYILM